MPKKDFIDDMLHEVLDPNTWKSLFSSTTKTTETVEMTSPSSRFHSRSDEKSMHLQIDLPGVDPKYVTLTAQDGKFIVAYSKGEKKFTEKYTINSDFDVKTANAAMEHGQLIVVLTRALSEPKKIPITIR